MIFSIGIRSVYAQSIVKGLLKSEIGEPIAYANIGIEGSKYGTSSFEDGTFELKLPKEIESTLITFSAIGFSTKELAISDLLSENNLVVTLGEKERVLDEVIVKPENLQQTSFGTWRSLGGKSLSFSRPAKGAEMAALIKASHQPYRLDKITIRIGSDNLKYYQMRCRFYYVDPITGQPSDDLILGNFIEQTNTNKGKLVFDFSGQNIWLESDIFMSFEWITDKKQSEKIIELYEKMPKDFFKEYKKEYPDLIGQIFNDEEIRMVDSTGVVRFRSELSKKDSKYLKERDKRKPRVFLRTTEGAGKTYYRSSSHGKWIFYPEDIITTVEISY